MQRWFRVEGDLLIFFCLSFLTTRTGFFLYTVKWYDVRKITPSVYRSVPRFHQTIRSAAELEFFASKTGRWNNSKEPRWWRRWRGREMGTEVKQERRDGRWLDGERSGVVSKSVPPLMCVSSHHRDLLIKNLPTYLAVLRCLLTALRSGFVDRSLTGHFFAAVVPTSRGNVKF